MSVASSMNLRMGLIVALALGGCAANLQEQRRQDLARTASTELSCPIAALELVSVDQHANKTAVRGCSRDVTYVWTADGWQRDARRADR